MTPNPVLSDRTTIVVGASRGLGRGIASEHPELRFTTVDLGPDPYADLEATADLLAVLPTSAGSIAVRGGARHVPRLVLLDPDRGHDRGERVARLTKYRDSQLKRLKAFNDACATRLANMGRFKAFAKTVASERRSSLLDVTS